VMTCTFSPTWINIVPSLITDSLMIAHFQGQGDSKSRADDRT
jgi:hypothetical protein